MQCSYANAPKAKLTRLMFMKDREDTENFCNWASVIIDFDVYTISFASDNGGFTLMFNPEKEVSRKDFLDSLTRISPRDIIELGLYKKLDKEKSVKMTIAAFAKQGITKKCIDNYKELMERTGETSEDVGIATSKFMEDNNINGIEAVLTYQLDVYNGTVINTFMQAVIPAIQRLVEIDG